MRTKKIRIETLTEANVNDLPELEGPPESCSFCLYWEHPQEWNRLQSNANECLKRKAAWIKTVTEGFGCGGKLLYHEDKCVGWGQFAPIEYLPAVADHPSGPVSPDAVLLSCLFIGNPRLRKKGLGTRLLKAIIAELKHKGVKALETIARKGNPENPSGPAEFYLKAGFKVLRDDKEYPLLRFDLLNPPKENKEPVTEGAAVQPAPEENKEPSSGEAAVQLASEENKELRSDQTVVPSNPEVNKGTEPQ